MIFKITMMQNSLAVCFLFIRAISCLSGWTGFCYAFSAHTGSCINPLISFWNMAAVIHQFHLKELSDFSHSVIGKGFSRIIPDCFQFVPAAEFQQNILQFNPYWWSCQTAELPYDHKMGGISPIIPGALFSTLRFC